MESGRATTENRGGKARARARARAREMATNFSAGFLDDRSFTLPTVYRRANDRGKRRGKERLSLFKWEDPL